MTTSTDLFTDAYLEAFAAGEAASLVTHRNPHLGSLLMADRGVFYAQILYRMLLFRRGHELEPLYQDVYDAVRHAQEQVGAGAEYPTEQFRADVTQLTEWGLVTCRIEIERLRGYKDTRRRKFRYSLTDDSIAFLEWLEERFQEELESPENDTRDLLEEVRGALKELLRVLKRFRTAKSREGDERRILYQLLKLDELTFTANANLSRFNARLLGFVVRHYELSDAKDVLAELETFVDRFLRQIHELRAEIVDLLGRLLQSRQQAKLRTCIQLMEDERKETPQLFRRTPEPGTQLRIPSQLREFYRTNGKLDAICRRIQASAIGVWRKLHAHLRELERRNDRLEDLRARIQEMALLPEDAVPRRFMTSLIAAGRMLTDPHFWDDHERAEPPQPRRRPVTRPDGARHFLHGKRRSSGPVLSMERARMARLKRWLDATLGAPYAGRPQRLSQGAFTEFEDFSRIMELSRAGLLSGGRKLERIQYRLTPEAESSVDVSVDSQRLSFYEILLERQKGDQDRSAPA